MPGVSSLLTNTVSNTNISETEKQKTKDYWFSDYYCS